MGDVSTSDTACLSPCGSPVVCGPPQCDPTAYDDAGVGSCAPHWIEGDGCNGGHVLFPCGLPTNPLPNPSGTSFGFCATYCMGSEQFNGCRGWADGGDVSGPLGGGGLESTTPTRAARLRSSIVTSTAQGVGLRRCSPSHLTEHVQPAKPSRMPPTSRPPPWRRSSTSPSSSRLTEPRGLSLREFSSRRSRRGAPRARRRGAGARTGSRAAGLAPRGRGTAIADCHCTRECTRGGCEGDLGAACAVVQSMRATDSEIGGP